MNYEITDSASASERRTATRRANAEARRAARFVLAQELTALADDLPIFVTGLRWSRRALPLIRDAALLLSKD